jgi:hypothetical protein
MIRDPGREESASTQCVIDNGGHFTRLAGAEYCVSPTLDLRGAQHHHAHTYSREIPGKGLRNHWARPSGIIGGVEILRT